MQKHGVIGTVVDVTEPDYDEGIKKMETLQKEEIKKLETLHGMKTEKFEHKYDENVQEFVDQEKMKVTSKKAF